MSKATAMRVVSGIQPTGDLHLGNLLGAILRWVRMQDEAECLFFLADLHALTVDVDPAQLRSNVREMAAALIASGIDPDKSIVFAHSAVPAHAELAWMLDCTARMGWLNRMTQWKDKVGQEPRGRERRPVRLPGAAGRRHPALPGDPCAGRRRPEAAYRARPRHRDQVQHRLRRRAVRSARAVHRRRGRGAGDVACATARAKMSKSDPSDMSRINLTDSDDAIAQKIRKAKTDPEPLPDDPALLDARPEARNLVGIYAAVTGESVEQVLARFAGQGFGAFKPALADALIALLAPLRARLERVPQRPGDARRIARRPAPSARPSWPPRRWPGPMRAVGLSRSTQRLIDSSAGFLL